VQHETVIEAAQTTQARVASASDEASAWKSLGEAKTLEAFGTAWITLVCRTCAGLQQAALLLGRADAGPFDLIAYWLGEGGAEEAKAFVAALQPLISVALKKRRPALDGVSDGSETQPIDRTLIGFPLIFAGEVHGIVLVGAVPQDTLSARRTIRHIEWSSGWIEAFLRRASHEESSNLGDKAAFLVHTVEAMIAQRRHVDAARALAGSLAHRLGCSHGAVGQYRHHRIRLVALSQTAVFDRKGSLSKAFEAAGEEAADQGTALVAPAADEGGFVLASQNTLSSALGGAHVLTVPLVVRQEVVGSLTLARQNAAFTQQEIELVDAVGAAAAPILRDKAASDRMLLVIAYDRGCEFLGRLFGPEHLGLKLGAIAAVAATGYLVFATDEYRIRAHAEVQGEVQRVLSAPFDGYIKSESARAGDIVRAGTVIAELQDNDLVLDRLRHASQKRQYQFELDKALAKQDLAQINIAQAQIDQADADIELADQMLARAQVKAPFDSVVVNGDLSQSVGRPVARGDILFEIAPLDRYRVTIVIPETDISFAQTGQRGELLLSAFPDQTFPFEIRSITPIARASDGVNGFEAIGSLLDRDERIRPAMEGIAKIEAGKRSLVWIVTHAFVSWLRIKIWSLLP
jgi:hypothetical protein